MHFQQYFLSSINQYQLIRGIVCTAMQNLSLAWKCYFIFSDQLPSSHNEIQMKIIRTVHQQSSHKYLKTSTCRKR